MFQFITIAGVAGISLLMAGAVQAESLAASTASCARGWQADSSCILNEKHAGKGRAYLKKATANAANSNAQVLPQKTLAVAETEVVAAENAPIEIRPGKQTAAQKGTRIAAVRPNEPTSETAARKVTNAPVPPVGTGPAPSTATQETTSPISVDAARPVAAEKIVTSLDKVTVTATRSRKDAFSVPGMVSVVNRDDPKVAMASDYKGLLADVPGLEFQGSARKNGQVPVMRGFDADSILILKDGVRQNFHSQHDGQFFLDPELLKQVEVVRGPGSALYGSGGLGGVISFTTVDAADLLLPGQKVGAKVTTGYQSVNKEFLTSAATYGRAGDLDLLANAVYRNSGDIKLGDGSTLPSDDSIKSGLAKAAWNFAEDQTLRVSYETFVNDAVEPNNPQIPAASGTNTIASKSNVTQSGRVAYEYKDFKTQVYHTLTSVEEEQLERSDQNRAGDVLERELTTTGVNVDNQNRFTVGEKIANVVSYGVEYYTNQQDGTDTGQASGVRGGAPDAEAHFYGGYVQDEILLADGKFTLTPAARFDNYTSENDTGTAELDESAFSPKLGVGYKPMPWLFLFGSYASAFRAPNLTELYASGTHFNVGPFQNNFQPNPDLGPEKSNNVEAGVGFTFNDLTKRKDSWRFKVSGYRTDAEDFIDTEIAPPTLSAACFLPNRPPGTVCNGGTTQYVNIPSASINGMEIEGGYEDKLIIFSLGYARMNGRNDDSGEYVTNIQPDTLKTSLAFKLPDYDTVAGWRGQFVSEFDKVNSALAVRDSYQVHDVYMEYRPMLGVLKNLTLNVGVDNIFDEAYERIFAGSFEPGRNYKVKAGYKW